MKNANKTTRLFTGTEVMVGYVKSELEKNDIPSFIKNDFQSGVISGFSGGVPSAIDLFIQESDVEKAKPILAGIIPEID